MSKTKVMSYDPMTTYFMLEPGGGVSSTPGGEEFWSRVMQEPQTEASSPSGDTRLICGADYSETWKHWEMHPAGDEIVYVLSGVVDVVLELPEGKKTVQLTERTLVVVPKGVWHTAIVHKPGYALHITPGEGTQLRPASDKT